MPFIMFLQPVVALKASLTRAEVDCMGDEPGKSDFNRAFFMEFDVAEKDFTYSDITHSFDGINESLFLDWVHYNDVAAQKVAEIVYSHIEPAIKIAEKRRN